jgi:pilus assembly protein CpaB
MPAKAILVALFLLSIGVVAVVCLEALPQRMKTDVTAADDILVAATALSSGALLRNKDVTWQPATGKSEPGQIKRPSNAAADGSNDPDQQVRSEVYGAALRVNLAAGEPIRRNTIVKPGDREFLQIVLSPGARAIAIPVAIGGASTSLLSPGDRVDVILTQTFKNDPPLTRRSVSETVVEDLRVLTIDTADTKAAGASSSFGRTVTLEVTSQQAEKISVATELGKLSLVLRGNGSHGIPLSFMPGFDKNAIATPVWAGDVSSALGDAALPPKANTAVQPTVDVLHGIKSVAVKLQ